MGMQDQEFKSCKKSMPSYKERGITSPYKCNLPNTHQISHGVPPPIYRMGSKCKTVFDLLVFHHGF